VLWVTDGRGLVGVSALKNPRQSYSERVFAKSRSGLRYADYSLEFGYLYVEEDRRGCGYGSALTEGALILAGNAGVFATTREANTEVHPRLVKQGFEQIGVPYESKRGDFNLLLFVRQAPVTSNS
jgi:GNAT superfamily N-acetyltransferase